MRLMSPTRLVSPEFAGRALNYVEQTFSPLSLTLNVAMCKWWCGQAGVAPTELPASVQREGVLPVLDSALPYVVASELEPLDLLDAEAPLAQARVMRSTLTGRTSVSFVAPASASIRR